MNALWIELMVVFSQGIISGMFFQIFCNRRESKIPVISGWMCYFAFQLFIIFVDCFIPDIFLIVGMYFLWSGLVYEGAFTKKALFSFVLIAFAVVSEALFAFFTSGLKYKAPLLEGKVVSSIILLTLVVFSNILMKKKTGQEDKYDKSTNAYLLFISLGSISIIFTIVYLASFTNEGIHSLLVFFSTLVILVINMFIFSLYNLQAKHLETKRFNTVYEQQIILHENYMKERELIWKEIREKQHDFNNNLLVLEQFVINSDTKQALDFIRDMGKEKLQIIKNKVSQSDNLVVDTIVNYKAEVAKEYGIEFVIDIKIPFELPMKPSDLSIILGNLLDNAIEALKEMKSDKVVRLKMRFDSNSLFIIIENGFVGKRKKKLDGSYITSKKDVESHGIGMASVKKIVNSYQGVMQIQERDNKFKVSISMFF